MSTERKKQTENLVLGAILTAIVVVLQILGGFIKFGPFSVSLVLIPIVIGAAKCGVSAAQLRALKGKVAHFFHLAAIYSVYEIRSHREHQKHHRPRTRQQLPSRPPTRGSLRVGSRSGCSPSEL